MADLAAVDFPISTPPDDLCLYHCISFARDPALYLSVLRSDAGHFVGERALEMTQRARSIRDELIALLRVFSSKILSGYAVARCFLFLRYIQADVALENIKKILRRGD